MECDVYSYRLEKSLDEVYLVIDGHKHGPFAKCYNFNFINRPDSDEVDFSYYACWEHTNGNYKISKITADGGFEKSFISPTKDIFFSPDGNHYGYSVKEKDGGKVVIDGNQENFFKRVGDLKFSPDSKNYAYPVKIDGEKLSWVVNGKLENDKFMSANDFRFSADGKHYSYLGRITGSSSCVVKDGVKGEVFTGSCKDYKSLDGAKIAYNVKSTRFIIKDLGDGRKITSGEDFHFVVNDGIKGKEYESVQDLTFSADGEHLAYIAANKEFRRKKSDWKEFLVFDEKENTESFNKIDQDSIKFSPDGRHYAYIGRNILDDDKKDEDNEDNSTHSYQAVVDGKLEADKFDFIYDLNFLPGKLVYAGKKDGKLIKIVKYLDATEKTSPGDQIKLTGLEQIKKKLLDQIETADWTGVLNSLGIKPEILTDKIARQKKEFFRSPSTVERLNRLIKKSPEVFRPTLAALASAAPSRFVAKIVDDYLFPEAGRKKKEQAARNSYEQRFAGYRGFSGSNERALKQNNFESAGKYL